MVASALRGNVAQHVYQPSAGACRDHWLSIDSSAKNSSTLFTQCSDLTVNRIGGKGHAASYNLSRFKYEYD